MAEANIWQPRTILQLSADTKRIEEKLVATTGQTLFTLQDFSYSVDTGSLAVYLLTAADAALGVKGARLLKEGVDWVEGTTTTFSVVAALASGDQIIAVGYVAITANVDVRDTDIFVPNYQAIRDYAGTEITLYAQGKATIVDGGENFFGKITGAAPGTHVDNNENIIVPAGGDGSIAWLRRVVENSKLFPLTVAAMTADARFSVADVGKSVPETKEFAAATGGSGKYDIIAGIATENGRDIIKHDTALISFVLRRAETLDITTLGFATSKTDVQNGVIIQAAHDLLVSVGGTLTYPVGTYNIDDLDMPNATYDGIHNIGLSASRTILNFTSTSISINMVSVQNVTFENMIIESPNSNTMIFLELGTQVAFKKVRHTNVGNNGAASKGYELVRSQATLFEEVSYGGTTKAETGFLIHRDSDANTFLHCNMKGATGCVDTIAFTAGPTNKAHVVSTIQDCVIGGGSNSSLNIARDGLASCINVTNNYFETGTNAIILGNSAGNFKAQQIQIAGNFFDGFTGNVINLNASDNVSIQYNKFTLGSTEDILVNPIVTKNNNITIQYNFLTLTPNVSASQRGIRYQEITQYAGATHDGPNNAAIMTDSSETFTVNQFVGKIINNVTDGSSGIITANTATTVTATLENGVDNDWDTTDSYTVVDFEVIIDRLTFIPDDSLGVTWDPPDILDGDEAALAVTVTNAKLGWIAMASFSLDIGGLTISAAVTAANTVTVTLSNNTGGSVNLASGTLRVLTIPTN